MRGLEGENEGVSVEYGRRGHDGSSNYGHRRGRPSPPEFAEEEEERRKRSEKVNEGGEGFEERMSQATDAAVLPPESAVAEEG